MGFLTAVQMYSDEIIGQSGGGVFDELESIVVPQKHILEVRHCAVENQTTNYTRLLLGLKRGSDFRQKEEEDTPSANDVYWSYSRFLVPEGWVFCARLFGCTALDILVMTIEGMMYKKGG